MRHPTSGDPRPDGLLGRRPSAVLLATQTLAVVAYPFLDDSTVGRSVLGVVQIVVVAAALTAVRRTPALTWVALLLGVPAAAFTVVEAFTPGSSWVVLVSALLHAPFYFYVSYSMVRYLFHDDRVTRDELYATGAAFTVVAWGFAYVYSAVSVLSPGSFAADPPPTARPGSSCSTCPSRCSPAWGSRTWCRWGRTPAPSSPSRWSWGCSTSPW